MRRFCNLFLPFMVLLIYIVGCSSEEKDTDAGTKTVPLKVWVVRAPNDAVVEPQIRQNKGCRLTDDEIRAHIHKLQANASQLYGANIEFQWEPEQPVVIIDQALALLPAGMRSLDTNHHYNNNIVRPGADNWAFSHINLYFVGDIQDVAFPYPVFPAAAFTFDPKVLSDAGITPLRPHIMMNDGGFDSGSGFPPRPMEPGGAPLDFAPPVFMSYNVLEHEMTHYLGRFDFQCYPLDNPAPDRCYSTTEHSNNENNVLRAGIFPPVPLVLPGSWDDPNTEAGQIWERVFNERFNNP